MRSIVKHDSFGYAVPSKNDSARIAKPTCTPYAVVNVTQKQLSHEKNNNTKCTENDSSVPSHLAVSEESAEPNKVEPLYSEVTEPMITATCSTAENSDEIEPYATVDILVMDSASQKQKTLTEVVHNSSDSVMQSHAPAKSEYTGAREDPLAHKPVKTEPMYSKVTEFAAAKASRINHHIYEEVQVTVPST